MALKLNHLRPASRISEAEMMMQYLRADEQAQARRRAREQQDRAAMQNSAYYTVPSYAGISRSDRPIYVSSAQWNSHGESLSNALRGYSASAAVMEPVEVVPMPEMGSIATVPIEVSDEMLTDDKNRLAMEAEAVLGYTRLRAKIKAPSQLRCLLAKLEIEVLDAAQVQAYKAQAKQHMLTAGKDTDPSWAVTPLKDFKGDIPEFVIAKAIEVKRELPSAEFLVEHLQHDPFLIVTTREDGKQFTGWRGRLGEMAVSNPDEVMYLEVWDERSFEEKR